jgi:hypothetical protein
MANSEYEKKGWGSFANILKLDSPMDFTTTEIPYSVFTFARPVVPGQAVMIDDEIMCIMEIGVLTITVKRGCADTIPAPHPVDRIVWIFDGSMIGGDRKEWSAGETVGLKISPYTMAGGVPTEQISPRAVEFNFRFARPYPPAKLMVNSMRWFEQPTIDDTTPSLYFSWVHRDRVLQADRLIGHDDATIGPEPGVTYTLRIYNPITDLLVREEVGITGDNFTYRRSQATHDQGNPSEVLEPTFTLTAHRDGLDAWQQYSGAFSLVPSYPLESNYLPFDRRIIETPYVVNARRNLTADGNYALGMAARPSDRMSDAFDLIANGTLAATGDYTPWLTTDFRLPELETIINVRSSSLYDGVPLDGALVGKLALIDDEIVYVSRVIGEKQVEIMRGCCDTIPAVHIAGSRVWFFDAGSAFDTLNRLSGEAVDFIMRPGVYGPPVPLGELLVDGIVIGGRSALPYAPGQIVVNGRPWFEEAQSTSGQPVTFSWARRNRVGQGSQIMAHWDDDMEPELNQVTRLRFYYETPSDTPGYPAVVHVLRQIDVVKSGASPLSGVQYIYSYATAQADGNTAGQALGVCGTVVIYCRIMAARDGLESFQSYVVSIRVPSYPCV